MCHSLCGENDLGSAAQVRVVDKNMEVMMKYEDRNEDEVNYPELLSTGNS